VEWLIIKDVSIPTVISSVHNNVQDKVSFLEAK